MNCYEIRIRAGGGFSDTNDDNNTFDNEPHTPASVSLHLGVCCLDYGNGPVGTESCISADQIGTIS